MPKFRTIAFIATIALTLIIVIVVIYSAIHNLTPDKKAELLFTFVSNIFGTIIGALLAYFIALSQFKVQSDAETKKNQVDTTFSFHEEMINVEVSQARSETAKIFTDHIKSSNLSEFYSDLSQDEKRPIRLVLSFFRRLQLAIEYNRIDEKIAVDLLSGEFMEWYHKWLDHMVPDRWTTRGQIDKLNEWMKQNLSKAEYERMKNDALESRHRLLAKADKDVANYKPQKNDIAKH
ncbi:hypothetical protein NIES2107_15710 [Nostoc carneum NIES-2107]|nr:hypothetical protein NIES2107_15710 [Nostoc carneum NIES-2107]